jgi:WD40-like Beta Propeller Repeat
MRVLVFSLLLLCVSSALGAYNNDPTLTWRTLKTPHFAIHYHDGEEALARDAAARAEAVHRRLSKFFNWTPASPTDIVLTNRSDDNNGESTPFAHNTMTLFIAPSDDDTLLEEYDDWLTPLLTHEYTHILHLDKSARAPRIMRKIVGRFPLLFPNVYETLWQIEGIATYMETDDQRAVGRGQSSYYRALMRIEVEHGIKPLREVNQPLESWPAGTTAYLYGVYFYRFVAARYGERGIQRWIDAASGKLIPFAINTNSRAAFHKDLDGLWQSFGEYLNQQFQPELDAIRQHGVRAGVRVTDSGYHTGNPHVLPNGDLVYVLSDFQDDDRLMLLKAGAARPRIIARVHGTRFDVHPKAGILLVQPEFVNNASLFDDLYRVDLSNGRITRLTHGGRYRYAAWSPDGTRIAAVQYDLKRSRLQLLDAHGKILQTLWEGKPWEVIAHPVWSPDGHSIAAALWRPQSRWNLALFDLNERRWRDLTQTANVETQPRFTPDGKSILFSADYGGVYNIQRLSLADGRRETLTNVIGGAFNPDLSADGGTLYYTGLDSGGSNVYRLILEGTAPLAPAAARPPVAYPPVEVPPLTSVTTAPYRPWYSLRPAWWIPYLALGSQHSEVGVMTTGNDALSRHTYSLVAAYDFRNDWPIGSVDYVYDRWRVALRLSASRSVRAYTDSDGNDERLRRNDDLGLLLDYPWISYDRQWVAQAGISVHDESDAWRRGDEPVWSNGKDNVGGLALTYNSAKRYPRSISDSRGRNITLVAESSDLLPSDYGGDVYRLDWREYLALGGEHVLAARLAAGTGSRQARPFELGGAFAEGAAVVIAPSPLNKRSFALRGYPEGLAALRGRNMALGELELRFPIALIERGFMAPPIGVHELSGSVFVNSGDAWDDGTSPDRLSTGAGAELTAELIAGYRFGLDLRLGYARGFNQGREHQVYLTLGGSF